MAVIIFPGQGSQKEGMDPYLVDRHSTLFQLASHILGYDIVTIANSPQIHQTQSPGGAMNQTIGV